MTGTKSKMIKERNNWL